MNCLVVDDEPVARDILRTYIDDTPQLSLVAECESAIKAMEILKSNPVDLIFLDINMPKLSGINFLKTVSNPPKVILTTAYSEYALEGYELDVVDYLLKPFSFERFLKAVNKASPHSSVPSVNEHFVVVKADGKSYRINETDILFVESMGDYITLNTSEYKLTFNQTMKSFAEELHSDYFLRVHKSFLVSLNKIDFVEGNMISIGAKKIPIGNSYKSVFQEKFSQ